MRAMCVASRVAMVDWKQLSIFHILFQTCIGPASRQAGTWTRHGTTLTHSARSRGTDLFVHILFTDSRRAQKPRSIDSGPCGSLHFDVDSFSSSNYNRPCINSNDMTRKRGKGQQNGQPKPTTTPRPVPKPAAVRAAAGQVGCISSMFHCDH